VGGKDGVSGMVGFAFATTALLVLSLLPLMDEIDVMAHFILDSGKRRNRGFCLHLRESLPPPLPPFLLSSSSPRPTTKPAVAARGCSATPRLSPPASPPPSLPPLLPASAHSPVDPGLMLPSKPTLLVNVGVHVVLVVRQLQLVPFLVLLRQAARHGCEAARGVGCVVCGLGF